VFTARYALSPYIKQIRFVFKGLNIMMTLSQVQRVWNKLCKQNAQNIFLSHIFLVLSPQPIAEFKNEWSYIIYIFLICLLACTVKTLPSAYTVLAIHIH
jgi:hypothetical protein